MANSSRTPAPCHLLRLALLLLLLPLLSTEARSGGKRANAKVLPVFRNLPPPLIYYRPNTPVKLTCSALPRNAHVQLVFRAPGDTNFQSLSGKRSGGVDYVVQNADNVRGSDLHCRARSSLGQVLSRPIRLVKTVLNASDSYIFTRTYTFYRGNVAQVMCAVPYSQPPADVQFFKDGDRIGQLDKYKVVRINSRKVVMLIKEFSRSDTGRYSCRATNPKTLQTVNVNQRTKLNIESPKAKIRARLHVEDPFRTKQKKVVLREGDNATLYCLPEGAPIPSVKWYRHSNSKRLPDNAVIDPAFGTLQLTKVRRKDDSVYMCSVEQGTAGNIIRTSPVTVSVLPRLKIIDAPRDVKVKSLGQVAKFTCTVSGSHPDGRNLKPKDEVRPEWYHNGQYLNPRADDTDIIIRANRVTGAMSDADPKVMNMHGSLTITRVTKKRLGVYQCVARSKTEWDSASAALALASEKIVNGDEWQRMEDKRKAKKKPRTRKPKPLPSPRQPSRSPYQPYGKQPPSVNPADHRGPRRQQPVYRRVATLPAPVVKLIYDNLAVKLMWGRPSGPQRLQYYRVQYQKRRSSRLGNAAPLSWKAERVDTIEKKIREEYYFVLKVLKANYVFRFRVTAVFDSGKTETSAWSKEADFSHVIPAQPTITEVKPIGGNALKVTWSYKHPKKYPQLDNFVLLARRLLEKGGYEGYSEFRVNADQRTYVISRLRPGTDYQVVIYGLIRKVGGKPRMITRFSSEVGRRTALTNMDVRAPGPAPPGNSSADSTKLMFWILGGLASVMVLVMAVLVAMCFLRQRREKKRSRAALHAQVNGTSLDSYKDPAKLLHRRQHAKAQAQANSQFLLAQLAGGPNSPTSGTGTWSGPAPSAPQHGGYLRGSSASVQQLPGCPPGSGMNLNVVPETQSLMLDHLAQQHGQPEMVTDLGGYGPAGMFPMHSHHNGTLGSKSHLGLQSHHHPHEHDMGDMGYPVHTGSVGPYRPLGSGYAPFMSGGLRPSHLDVRPPPTGDAESIYSYFSQQEMGVQHCGLSDVPGAPPTFRPQLAEAGSQTTDRQQHRHHRRRRRKQPPGAVPPTGPGGPLPTALEHSLAPSPPVMRDMAVNTDMSSDGTYDRPANGHQLPPGYHPQHLQHMHHQQLQQHQHQHQQPPQHHQHQHQQHQHQPQHMVAVSAAGQMPQYDQAVSPPARLASLGYASQPAGGDLGPSDASTLTRRGTPTLFVDPPKMRDYSEYAIPETKA